MFKHVITRDVAYDLMLGAQRRALHRAIAEWYEQRHQAQLPRFYPLLAYHWTRSGVTAKAIRYLSLAGEQALAGAAYREAALFLADALALDQPAESGGSRQDRLRRARWERQLGEAYLGLGRTSDGRTHLSRALELLGVPLPTTKRQLAGRLCNSWPSRPPTGPSRQRPCAARDSCARKRWRPAGSISDSPRSSGSPTTPPPLATPASGR